MKPHAPAKTSAALASLLAAVVDTDDVVALVRDEVLVPVDGDVEAVLYPPTYAGASGEGSRYALDRLSDGTQTVIVDSPQSQANRMETVFLRPGYADLVPDVRVTVRPGGNEEVTEIPLLTMGHRLADAAVRFSAGADQQREAFEALARHRDASRVARLGPTSLVYGVWDSRGTHAKVPRLLTSTVRAWDVIPLTRSAQYVPAYDFTRLEGLGLTEEEAQAAKDAQEGEGDGKKVETPALKKFSTEGLAAVPSTGKPGGVLVRGRIVRKVTVNASALRNLRTDGVDETSARLLRSYVLGLALVSATHPMDHDYRSGCLLVPDPAATTPWSLVRRDGTREAVELPHAEVLAAARTAAAAFGVGPSQSFEFEAARGRAALEGAAKPKPAKPASKPRKG